MLLLVIALRLSNVVIGYFKGAETLLDLHCAIQQFYSILVMASQSFSLVQQDHSCQL